MPAPKPNVTIFADASHDHNKRAAGWAAWIKADGREAITCGAAMKKVMKNATEAELCAIANALTVARLHGLLSVDGCAMVQSDCHTALALIATFVTKVIDNPAPGGLPVTRLKRKLARHIKKHAAAINVIQAVVSATGLTIITRHVRGHREGDGRQWVNRLVDVRARREMRMARAKSKEHQDNV